MTKQSKFRLLLVTTLALSRTAFAGETDIEAEKQSYLPLIPNMTYTYSGEFKGRTSTTTEIVKTVKIADTDVFYFVAEKDVRNPNAILGTESFGLGGYVKNADGIATLDSFFRNELNAFTKAQIGDAVTILKSTPEKGAVIVVPSPKKMMNHTFKVEGNEDVTVPAGTFKDCLKIKTEEIHLAKPPEKEIVYTGTVWLAKGVGVVKWIRGTGRVDELVSYK
jgi:hypothetical protein